MMASHTIIHDRFSVDLSLVFGYRASMTKTLLPKAVLILAHVGMPSDGPAGRPQPCCERVQSGIRWLTPPPVPDLLHRALDSIQAHKNCETVGSLPDRASPRPLHSIRFT